MTGNKMKTFMESVLNLREAEYQDSQKLLPKVVLERLTLDTIQQYSKKLMRYHMTSVTPSSDETDTPRLNIPDTEGKDEGDSDSDSASSESNSLSDSLPDLNDPSWATKEKERKIEKKRATSKVRPKLMMNAKKTFEHKVKIFKSSREYIKSSKTIRDMENADSHSHQGDNVDHHSVSNMSDPDQSNTMLRSLLTAPATASPPRSGSTTDSSYSSNVEIITSKLNESLARYTEPKRPNFHSDDASDSGLESLNTQDPLSIDDNARMKKNDVCEVLLDSDDSNSTVTFEDNQMQNNICYIESVQSLSAEVSVDEDPLADNVINQKRKENCLGSSNSEHRNKKLRKDDHIIHARSNANEQPMVIIPWPVQDQPLSPDKSGPIPTEIQVGKPQQTQADPIVPAPAIHSESTSPVNKENSSTSVGDNSVKGKDSREVINKSQTTDRLDINQSQATDRLDTVTGPSPGGKNDQEKNNSDTRVAIKTLKQMSVEFNVLTTNRNELEEKIEKLKKEYNKKLEALEEEKKKCETDIKNLIIAMGACKDVTSEEQPSPKGQHPEGAAAAPTNIHLLIHRRLPTTYSDEDVEVFCKDLETTKKKYKASTRQPASEGTASSQDAAAPTQTTLNTTVPAEEVNNSASRTPVTYSAPGKMTINVIPAANIKNFGTKKLGIVKTKTVRPQTTAVPSQATAIPPQATAVPPQTTAVPLQTTAVQLETTAVPPQATAVQQQTTAVPPHATAVPADPPPRILQESVHVTTGIVVQPPVSVFSKQGTSRNIPSSSGPHTDLQAKGYISAIDQPSPPNVVVMSNQQQPVSGLQAKGYVSAIDHASPPNVVVSSQQQQMPSHMVCRMPPAPPTIQRRPTVGHTQRRVRPSNPGAVAANHKGPQTETGQSSPSNMQPKRLHPGQMQKPQQPQVQQQQQFQQQHQQQLQQHQGQQQQIQWHQHQQQQQQQLQPQLQQQQIMQEIQVLQPQQQQQHHMQEMQHLQKQKTQYQQQQFMQNQQHQQSQQAQNQQQQVSYQSSSTMQLSQQYQKSQPFMQPFQQGQGQLSNNVFLREGAPSAGFIGPVNRMNSDTCTSAQGVPNIPLVPQSTNPSSNSVISYSQRTSRAIQNNDTERRLRIVSSMTLPPNSNNIVQNVQPLSSQTHNKFFIPVSNFIVSNNNANVMLPVQAAQTPSSNQSTSQPTEVTLDIPDQTETKATEPLCKVCGMVGIFACCRDVIYCSVVCQRNDWVTHQHNCTNNSLPEGS